MQSQQSKGWIFLSVVVALAAVSFWFYQSRDFVYGLDIRGGSRIEYTLKFDEDPNKAAEQRKNLATISDRLLTTLRNRVAGPLGVAEASVQRKGEDRFVIELPDEKNLDKARSVLGSAAKIIAYEAKTVRSPRADWRRYDDDGQKYDEKTGSPYIAFRDTVSGKVLTPKDPEYAAMIKEWPVILEGEDLASAVAQQDAAGRVQPSFRFSGTGSTKIEEWSRRNSTTQENIAFVLDGQVLSLAPLKENTVLNNGEAFIDGDFDAAYVNRLVSLLNAGALPIELQEQGSAVLEPTIGDYAFKQMLTAGFISFGVTILFLLAYYAFPGFVALVALGLYTLFTLCVMKLTNQTLSLAGMAGFILSIGMAVDANILVFERMKEEMREGRSLMTAVELGFKRAFPAILDSNACTILTSIVLAALGTGPVKGFATTLIIGVTISLFTAVTVTRSLLVFLVGSGIGNNEKYYAMNRSWFGEKYEATANENPFKIMSGWKKYFMISLATIVPGLIFIGIGGIKPNVEFRGGLEAEYFIPAGANITGGQIEENLKKAGFEHPIVKFSSVAEKRVVGITVDPPKDFNISDPKSKEKIGEAVGISDPPASFQFVGPTIQKETVENAIKGIVFSSALIVLYLAVRFGVALGGVKNGLKFGLSAIGALVHDVAVVIGIAAIVGYLANWQVSSLFVTAMLTVIGFSVHDTIVIFDRIRENLRSPMAGETFEHLCDRSVTQSFGRSLNTSITVIATLAILIFMGTPTIDLKLFCITMLAGIVSGTYSSIFNAAPILWLWDKATERRLGPTKTLMAEAVAEAARIRATQVAISAGGAAGAAAAPQSYGTVRRRRSVKDQARKDLD